MDFDNIRADLVALIATHGSKRNSRFIDPDVVMLGLEMGMVDLLNIETMSDSGIAFAIWQTIDGPWWIDEGQIAMSIHAILEKNGTYNPEIHNRAINQLASVVILVSDTSEEAMINTTVAVFQLENCVRFHSPDALLDYFGFGGYQFDDITKLLLLLTELNQNYAILPANDIDPDIIMFPDHPLVQNLSGAFAVAAAMGELVKVDA
jgi:hypothetical protein